MAMIILPPELFYQVALHLPSTGDVLTFTLIHSRVREILSTPVLFKERLTLQGWDVSAWLEEDNNATVSLSPQGYLERWMRIDHIYCRTVQLFDDAAADDYFLKSPPNVDSDRDATEPEPEQPDRGLSNDIVTPKSPDQSPDPCNPGIDRQKRIIWMGKLSVVLPEFVAHHRGENILRITEARHRGALSTYASVLTSICGTVPPNGVGNITSASGSLVFKPELPKSRYAWLERSCFCLAALLIQCDANMVTSTFSDIGPYIDFAFPVFKSFWTVLDDVYTDPMANMDLDLHTLPTALSEAMSEVLSEVGRLRISERYSSTFLIQAMIYMILHSGVSLPLRVPSLPYINPAAFFSYDEDFEPKQGIPPLLLPSPPPRPWLRNRLAGTPLAEFLSSANGDGGANGGHLWDGYYTLPGGEALGPPMFLELYSVEGPIDPLPLPIPDPLEHINFRGKGHDALGTFTLTGDCHVRTGAVTATKSYATHDWKWRGMVTPFGMAGIWGLASYSGWWWIWPREWSNHEGKLGPDWVPDMPEGVLPL